MREIARSTGIIIKTFDYKDSCIIADILTEEGISSYLIKGAKKLTTSTHKYDSIPTKITFNYAKKDGIQTITEAQLVDNYSKVKLDLKLYYQLCIVLEKISYFKEGIQDTKTLYNFLETFIEKFNSTKYPELMVQLFEIKFLYLLGYIPEFNHCVRCGSYFNVEGFSLKDGGMVCKECLNSDTIIIRNIDSLKAMYKIKIQDLNDDFFINIADSKAIIDEFYSYHLEFTSKVKRVLRQINL